jgi:hypothetical protein
LKGETATRVPPRLLNAANADREERDRRVNERRNFGSFAKVMAYQANSQD